VALPLSSSPRGASRLGVARRLFVVRGRPGAGVSASNRDPGRFRRLYDVQNDPDRSFATESAIRVTWCTTVVDEVTRIGREAARGR
jgi:hypothetical protein